MQNLNRSNSFSFSFVAILVVVTTGLMIAVSIPTIQSWQTAQIDKLLAEANQSEEPASKQAKLKQAATIGINDPVAIEALANSYWQIGEYNKAIGTYQSSWTGINDIYLGTASLKSSQPQLAKSFFSNSDKAGESAESQAGLASVAYIENRVDEGCNHADRAAKLNLSSAVANQAVQVCSVLNTTSTLAEKEQTYLLINNYIYDLGLARLESVANKSSTDWLLLAVTYASRGELVKAENTVQSGLAQSPSDQTLLRLAIKLIDANGKAGESSTYQNRLEDLQFEKFQN